MSSPLSSVRKFRIEAARVRETLKVLREAGRKGFEAFVLWGGTVSEDGAILTFTTVIAPPQTAHKTRNGLLVTVDGDALFKVNQSLYARGELLAGQVHSHPTDAYHSDTDDHNPLVTLHGALSVVVPDFGAHAPDDLDSWAWYRLVGTGRWAPLTGEDYIDITEDSS